MTARISYNSKTIDFPRSFSVRSIEALDGATRSPGLHVETLNAGVNEIVRLGFVAFERLDSDDATFRRKLEQWFEWARQGGAWTFAKDSSKTVNTTLASGASAGAGSVVVASATGITTGELYVVRTLDRMQIVKVTGTSGTTISFSGDSLDFDFASGARFRSREYWPGRLLDGPRHPILERGPFHFDVEIAFKEDLNDLTA